MHCNGKCQMRKQIGNDEKKDQQMPERKDSKNELVLACHSYYSSNTLPVINSTLLYPSLFIGKEVKMPRFLLRPPIA